jgi:hypothetical protein
MPTSLLHFGQRLALRASFNLVRGRKTIPKPSMLSPVGGQRVNSEIGPGSLAAGVGPRKGHRDLLTNLNDL